MPRQPSVIGCSTTPMFMVLNHQMIFCWHSTAIFVFLWAIQHSWFIEVGRIYQLYHHLWSIGACSLLIEEVCNCRALSHMNRGVHAKWKNFIHYCIPSHMGFQHGQHLSCSPSIMSLLCSGILRVGSNTWGTTLRSNGLYVGGIIIRHMNHLWSPVPGPGWAIITVLNLIFIPLCKTRK